MSTTSQTYADFRAVTELFMRLNRAVITVKRVVFGGHPQPEPTAQEAARTILTQFLTEFKQSLGSRPEELSQTFAELLERVHNGRLLSRELIEVALDRCLTRLGKGLRALRSEDLDFLDTITSGLDKSSENLYRQMARL
jgi:hypothetical protein